jgi:GT2 family glycosyltransferase
LAAAVASLRAGGDDAEVVVVENGGPPGFALEGVRTVRSDENLGVPGGRDLGVQATDASVIGFLDDDAQLLSPDTAAIIAAEFDRAPALGAIGFRIVDEHRESSRRHVPRVGGGSAERGGRVATFLGGACAIRRDAYLRAGGYWSDLFYAHEELELSWRLHEIGYEVAYEPRVEVVHPSTPISRHSDGWWRTGRNRVMIARRDLPWPVAIAHVSTWLLGGLLRAPGRTCKAAYVRGWWVGWSQRVERRPVRWRTVVRLSRLGRPPVV